MSQCSLAQKLKVQVFCTPFIVWHILPNNWRPNDWANVANSLFSCWRNFLLSALLSDYGMSAKWNYIFVFGTSWFVCNTRHMCNLHLASVFLLKKKINILVKSDWSCSKSPITYHFLFLRLGWGSISKLSINFNNNVRQD